MDPLDDYFEYAMDLPEGQRRALLDRLRADDPALCLRLERALLSQVRNPDFLCQEAPPPATPGAPDRVRTVSLPVGDIERATRWYLEVFRCTIVRRDGERCVLDFDGVRVQLVRRDVDHAALTLQRADVAEMGPTGRREDGVRGLHLVDPWGNTIEVVDRVD